MFELICGSVLVPGTSVYCIIYCTTWYPGITCENQPKLYFSVGLKNRYTVDGKIPSGYFSILDHEKIQYCITKKKSTRLH